MVVQRVTSHNHCQCQQCQRRVSVRVSVFEFVCQAINDWESQVGREEAAAELARDGQRTVMLLTLSCKMWLSEGE